MTIARRAVVALTLAGGLWPPALPSQAGPIQAGGRSTRIDQLEREQARSGPAAVAAFWQELGRTHTPIIEPADQPDRVRVTFVWRGSPDTTSARAFNIPMTHLTGTDVWYATMTMPKDHRVWYSIVANTPGSASNPVPDPLNPHRVVPPIAAERPAAAAAAVDMPAVVNSSIVVLPDTPASPWVDPRPQVATGRVEEFAVPSRVHPTSQRVWAYLPPGDGPPAGLLICLWGGDYLGPIPVPTILDNLVADNRAPRLAALFVDQTGDRFQDIRNTERFSAFVAGDLLPWARGRFHVPSDPRRTIVAGYSAGGLESAYLAFQYPDLIGNVLSQSGAFWRAFEGEGATAPEWLTQRFAASRPLGIRFFLDVGSNELGRPNPDGPVFVEANRHLAQVLTSSGYAVKFTEVHGGEHEFLHWRSTFADGVLFLTAPW